MKRLIVNADDFGLTAGVNRAIAELHSAGLVTSATLMARASATDEAISIACATPALGVGCHVVLVDGEPALPPETIPSLVDRRTGRFYPTLAAFLPRLFAGQIRAGEMQAEAEAQIRFLQQKGVRLTHIDAHKHAHMFPAVLRPLLAAARSCGIDAIRNPFEPAWSSSAAFGAPWARFLQVKILRWFKPGFLRAVAQAGFVTTAGSLAIAGTGALDQPLLRSLLQAFPDGTWELVTHPGYNDAALARIRTRLRISREIELRALPALNDFPSIQRISFADLTHS